MSVRPIVASPDRSDAQRGLAEALETLGLIHDRAQLDALLTLAELLLAWGSRINLTGHRTLEAIISGLVVESAALIRELPEAESLADIGSGAGFPGLPIGILRPACRVTLVEARERRHHFQRAAIRKLRLENVTPLRGRAEVLTPIPHAAAISQAMARPELALTWMIPWVRAGGRILIPGSAVPPAIAIRTGVTHETTTRYRVPGSGRERTLWVGRITE